MRKNAYVRVRRLDQRPERVWAFAEDRGETGIDFYQITNPFFGRDARMQSWRRPL
ncbi:hypothetical protein SAQ01S_07230 [Sphingomonas aquatilis NBRC 16722]|uniref:Uncharacterized protein n=1 Tax=Sphingomonas aquatilis TaxID=93063 RepID=A0AAW3TXA6_9SPHN|nr:hypothetical protein [Sphingomonas aquatilis]GEM70957.1 hypothetical protein SAQ01S_07230 [Sphingomonas aquatilis NBRC 16722]